MLGYQSSADWAVPVFARLCLSVLGCACLCYAVPVFVTLCLSVLGCACLCYAVPVRIRLCLSLLRCAYLHWAVPVFVRLCLSVLGCACLCWAVPVFVMPCLIEFTCAGPCVCLCCLETEYWPWLPFIHFWPSRAQPFGQHQKERGLWGRECFPGHEDCICRAHAHQGGI